MASKSTGIRKRPTSHDVAKLAGVSQPTVSVVFAGRARAVGISQSTERKVFEAAKELSYVPNRLMRSLRSGRSGIIGVFTPGLDWSLRHSYMSELVASLHEVSTRLEKEILFFAPYQSERSLDEMVDRMLSGLVDGVVVQPDINTEVIDRLIEAGFPTVAMGDSYRDIPSVTIDNRRGLDLLFDLLYSKGHRRFVYVRVENPESTRIAPHLAAEIRPDEYQVCLAKYGLDPESCPDIFLAGDLEGTIDRILAIGATAVICHNDEWAYPMLAALERRGIKIPEDLALVGFDGIPAPYSRRVVTTVASPIREMGSIAVELLLDLLNGNVPEGPIVLPVELVAGETA